MAFRYPLSGVNIKQGDIGDQSTLGGLRRFEHITRCNRLGDNKRKITQNRLEIRQNQLGFHFGRLGFDGWQPVKIDFKAHQWPLGIKRFKRARMQFTECTDHQLGPKLLSRRPTRMEPRRPTGHQLQNRSDQEAVLLEVGSRRPGEDGGAYPDIDLMLTPGETQYRHKDGTPYAGTATGRSR